MYCTVPPTTQRIVHSGSPLAVVVHHPPTCPTCPTYSTTIIDYDSDTEPSLTDWEDTNRENLVSFLRNPQWSHALPKLVLYESDLLQDHPGAKEEDGLACHDGSVDQTLHDPSPISLAFIAGAGFLLLFSFACFPSIRSNLFKMADQPLLKERLTSHVYIYKERPVYNYI
ncbi:uncharacterized protein EV422DRAFT_529323 [Fimicolochytrium jonesii]|uniref:uncharacterized protein n=1 Tax=Fimicolochytrium jonesii TaxID=1396493 RepID=UPI0022FEFA09|nr:uncharacterized protein EV422DRAFT_529323 [Fimicolochytrium jonesii]KAI8821145.1 hypothetical protein EV422DRAFT_529323 [Fimicolochytrium jonesii]